ncbi:MAG: KamA family radical SAM protein [Magnetococcales bacterium]|nr:KamA family radical SAM protein [Magnetococcales bacterium]
MMAHTLLPITNLDRLEQISGKERVALSEVSQHHAFLSNDYYLSLISWHDPEDPIRRLIIPDLREQSQWGQEDPSDEGFFTPMQGVQHKYDNTVLFLISNQCAGICRYCFRKRIFHTRHNESLHDLDAAIAYVKNHREVSNVLLTGGDPLMLPTRRLDDILTRLRQIDHVSVIRIGSKVPAFMPQRISNDLDLLAIFRHHSTASKRLYIMTHFTHPRELTSEADTALGCLNDSGVLLANQSPLIRGVNDHAATLTELFKRLAAVGSPQYYLLQCRPVRGNHHLVVPIEEGMAIFEQAKSRCSGLEKRGRYVMSHTTGKIEIVGLLEKQVILKYWQAVRRIDRGRVMIVPKNPLALWLEDYLHPQASGPEEIGASQPDGVLEGMMSYHTDSRNTNLICPGMKKKQRQSGNGGSTFQRLPVLVHLELIVK